MKPTVKICPDVQIASLRQLATVTILQAFDDARRARDLFQRLDAALWLTGPDITWWCEWAGLSFADIWRPMTSGAARLPRRSKA